MKKENDIDELFKRGLDDPSIPFNELDWEKMKQKLDVQKENRIIPLWMFTACGAAAILIIFLFWFFAGSTLTNKKTAKDLVTNHIKKTEAKKEKPQPDEIRMDLYAEKNKFPYNERLPVNHPTLQALDPVPLVIRIPGGDKALFSMSGTTLDILQISIDSLNSESKAVALTQSADVIKHAGFAEIASNVKKKMEADLEKRHELTLSILAAPDISSAKSSIPSKISSNVGILATYALNHKISVSSGAIYSRKFYNSSGLTSLGNNYMDKSWEVDADCNVLDIPLNVNYKLFSKKKLSVSVNTGLSSYFMLKEKYQFINGQPGEKQEISTLEINNQNQHLFGIANISVSFDHQISRSLSIGVQPFAKLPLTGIGNGDANLKSTGISFSLNIGLFSVKKPGRYADVRYPSTR